MESLTEGEELTLTDSDGVVAKGIHLEARLLKDVPGNYSTVYKQGSIVLVLVDSFGTAVRFNDNIEPVLSDSKEGKHVVYSIYDQATASEKLTSKAKALAALEKISVATATEKLKKEIALVKTIEDHVKSDNPTPLKFDITGGSMGYVVTDKNHRGPLKNLKEVLTKDNLKKGSDIAMSKEAKAASGITDKAFYITTDGLYGQWIEVERPGVQESNYEDVITSLLVDDLVNDKGEAITFAERNALLRSLINTNDNEGVKIEKSKDPTDLYGYTLSIGTVQVKLDTLNDKGAAKNKLEELYNKKRAGQFFVQKLHVS